MNWQYPPKTHRKDGEYRRVGFELEFSGVNLAAIGSTLVDRYGGRLERESAFRYLAVDTKFGDFTLEVDSIQLQDRRYIRFLREMGWEVDAGKLNSFEEKLADLAGFAVPFELVTPPVPMDQMHELDAMENELRSLHAKGTRASFMYGFGMQFNPEAPDLETPTLLAYLRAFLLLQEWLNKEIDVDITRRIFPFINPFPEEYVRQVLAPDYAPTQRQFMDDYLQHNPTRNRPLDLTCLFAHLDRDHTLARVEEPHLIKPRPTFHYRLPDCRIDEPEWSLALEWNRWVEVEKLADAFDAQRELAAAYLDKPTGLARWVKALEDWLADV